MQPMQDTTIALTSITYAIKAQNALRAHGIRCTITRDERYYTGKSCGYSITLRPGSDMRRVMQILYDARIKLAPVREG